MILQQTLLLILSIVLLWIGANYLVDSSEKIANKFGISQLVIGLTVVAFGTSAPEFAVTVSAAINAQASMSVGNIVGSNIFNLGFILGIVALFHPVKSTRKLVYRDGLFMIVTSLLLLLFFYTGNFTLSRIEGGFLFSLLILYLVYLFIKKESLEDDEFTTVKAVWYDFLIVPTAVVVIALGGKLLVSSAESIALYFGLSQWIIAITVVAAGTSAPEMVTSLTAIIKGKHDISAGNLIGSNIFNLLGVLGIAGIINPLSISFSSFQSLIFLILMISLALFFLRTKWRVSRLEGALLVLSGLALWTIDFLKM